MRLCTGLAAPVPWVTAGKNEHPAPNCSFLPRDTRSRGHSFRFLAREWEMEGSRDPLSTRISLCQPRVICCAPLSRTRPLSLSPARFWVFLSARGPERNRKTALPAPLCRAQPQHHEHPGAQRAPRQLPALKVNRDGSVPQNLSPPACCSRPNPGSSPPHSLHRARLRSRRGAPLCWGQRPGRRRSSGATFRNLDVTEGLSTTPRG